MHDASNVTPQGSAPRLTSAALCAMTRFAEAPSNELAALVARHLDCLAEHAAADAQLRDISNQLALRWRDWIVARNAQSQREAGH